MADEFEESEILFRENVEAEDSSSTYNHAGGGGDFPARVNNNISSQQRKLSSLSVPIIIPEMNYVSRSAWFGRSDFGGDEGEFVPPHVIIGRRVAGKVMAFSVCSGNGGGTLRGRHLSEFRNSILRMTGFLET